MNKQSFSSITFNDQSMSKNLLAKQKIHIQNAHSHTLDIKNFSQKLITSLYPIQRTIILTISRMSGIQMVSKEALLPLILIHHSWQYTFMTHTIQANEKDS